MPDEVFPLLLVLVAIAVVAGLARPRLLVGLLLLLLLAPVIGELFGVLLDAIPWWLVVMVVFGMATWMIRAALAVLIGREAAGHAVGSLAASAIRGMFKVMWLPFRLAGWLLRRRRA